MNARQAGTAFAVPACFLHGAGISAQETAPCAPGFSACRMEQTRGGSVKA